jgi:ParB family protein of integrating conjugative element (PFGI_1 class)
MNKQRPSAEQLAELITQPHFARAREAMPPTDPIQPTPMVVAIDEIEVYDHNPRQLANDRYDEIKASIRATGMDQTLTITRRPGAPRYMIAAGGNTRLQALKALWTETGEERFRQVHCLFRPWQGDTSTLVAHLKENDVRGDLAFIDRARGLTQLKGLVEAERGNAMSQREFSAYLGGQGYTISHTVLNSAAYATQSLDTTIPVALAAGMGRAQVDRIRKLHKAFVTAWSVLQVPDPAAGQALFLALLGRHDDDVIDLDLLHRDAVNELSVSADCDVQHAAMVYGAAIDGRDLGDLATPSGQDTQDPETGPGSGPRVSPTRTPAAAETRPTPPVAVTPSPAGPPAGPETPFPKRREAPERPADGAPPTVATEERVPVAITTTGTGTASTRRLDQLRDEAFRLAQSAAQMLGCDDIVRPIDTGLGFLVDAVPAEVRESLPMAQRPALLCAWWLLATVSEQFASHGLAEPAIPPDWRDSPVGEAMARASEVEHWQSRMAREKRAEALLAVPYMPASNYAAYGLHRVTDEFFDTWTALLAVTRAIYAATDGQPWA